MMSVRGKGYANYSEYHKMDGEPIVVTMTPAAVLSGTVVDRASRQPLSGVTVKLECADERSPNQLQTVSEDDGSFSVEDMQFVSYDISAKRSGYRTWQGRANRRNGGGGTGTIDHRDGIRGGLRRQIG